MTQRQRGIAVATITVVAAMLVALVGLTPSANATSYRYWTYWVGGDGDWTFSSQGASRHPADGTVEGWRFAISQAAGSSATPRVASSFDDICSDTDPVAGQKRVGLVLDFGLASDAPPGATPPKGPIARCLVLPLSASGYDVLVAATSIRVEKGLVCGIAGYPKTGCGEPVANPHPTDTDPPGGSGNPPGNGGGHHQSHPSGNGATPNPGSTTDPNQGGGGSSPSDSPSKHSGGHNKHDKPTPDASNQSQQPQPASEGDDGAPVDAAVALKAPLPSTDSSGSPIGMVVGLAAVAALSAGAFVAVRRRR